MSEEILKKEKVFTQHDVENKQLKEENEQLRKENEQLRKNNVAKDATIKESIKKPNEIKSPKEDKIRQIIVLIGLTKISLKKFYLLLTATSLITRMKLVNSSILA